MLIGLKHDAIKNAGNKAINDIVNFDGAARYS